MNAKKAAEELFDMHDNDYEGIVDEDSIEPIIQQCIDDALEAVAVQIESASDRNWRDGWPADWAVRIAREAMKSNGQADTKTV